MDDDKPGAARSEPSAPHIDPELVRAATLSVQDIEAVWKRIKVAMQPIMGAMEAAKELRQTDFVLSSGLIGEPDEAKLEVPRNIRGARQEGIEQPTRGPDSLLGQLMHCGQLMRLTGTASHHRSYSSSPDVSGVTITLFDHRCDVCNAHSQLRVEEPSRTG